MSVVALPLVPESSARAQRDLLPDRSVKVWNGTRGSIARVVARTHTRILSARWVRIRRLLVSILVVAAADSISRRMLLAVALAGSSSAASTARRVAPRGLRSIEVMWEATIVLT